MRSRVCARAYMCMCVHACMRACMSACVRVQELTAQGPNNVLNLMKAGVIKVGAVVSLLGCACGDGAGGRGGGIA